MKYQDIHLADKSLWQQYQQYMQAGQTAQALALLENAQLADKGMTADVFNGLTTEMVRLENQGKDSTWSKSVIPMGIKPPGGMIHGGVYFKGFIEDAFMPLNFTSSSGTIRLVLNDDTKPLTRGQLFYISYDAFSWVQYQLGDIITLSSDTHDTVYFKGPNDTVSETNVVYVKFEMTGEVYAGGNIMSLMDFQDEVPDHGLYHLFAGCTSLRTPPELPSLSVGRQGYEALFSNCRNLDVSNLILPATKLSAFAYSQMFSNCVSIVKAPNLIATILGPQCYQQMFSTCVKLTTAPLIAATSIPSFGCNSMFDGCTALRSAYLPATELGGFAYYLMFNGCSNLSEIKIGYTGNFNTSFNSWVNNVGASGTFYYNGSDTTRGTSAIPTGWTIQKF